MTSNYNDEIIHEEEQFNYDDYEDYEDIPNDEDTIEFVEPDYDYDYSF